MPFPPLPDELVLEIIRFAAQPQYSCDASVNNQARRPSYSAGLRLARVSPAFRRAAMQTVLDTVMLATSEQLLAFIAAIKLQNAWCEASSPLALDYPQFVRRLWCAECIEPLEDHPPDYFIDYAALYPVLRSADVLGFHFDSLHLLYNALSSSVANPEHDWTCPRLVLTGSPRWNPLKSTAGGAACLSRITHLTLWYDRPWVSSIQLLGAPLDREVHVEWFPGLTHLAITLPPSQKPVMQEAGDVYEVPMRVLVYANSNFGTIGDMLRHSDAGQRTTTICQARGRCDGSGKWSLEWDVPFMMGDAEAAWTEANDAQ
uniref:F-box domain-containing protein n=1 Tax=Mycena chlorophos TaxID=658473 RepID=A0ABQ0M3D1_MYCCL|nr:predicted protein [Mycena chlorophos]